MTSIAALSDCHLGYRHRSRRERLRDYLRSFGYAVQEIVKLKPDVLVVGGDLLHHPKPDPVSMRNALEKLLYMADYFPIVVLVGNHEIQGHLGTTYTPLFSSIHENIHVLTSDNPVVEPIEGVWFHGFQYIRGRDLAEKTLLEASQNASGGLNVLCLHQAVEGCLSPHELSMRVLRQVQEKYDLMLFGHVHKHQRIMGLDTPAYYIGATERVSFNEADNPTGFMYFPDAKGEPEYVSVPSASMRSIRLKGKAETLKEVVERVHALIGENKDVEMLKIDVEVDVADLFELNHGFGEYAEDFKILEVNINPSRVLEDVEFEQVELGPDLIAEYFEKTGVKDKALLDKCVQLYERYGG